MGGELLPPFQVYIHRRFEFWPITDVGNTTFLLCDAVNENYMYCNGADMYCSGGKYSSLTVVRQTDVRARRSKRKAILVLEYHQTNLFLPDRKMNRCLVSGGVF